MSITVKNVEELLALSRAVIVEAQREIVMTLAKDTAKTVRKKSSNQFSAETSFIPDGFFVGEPKTPGDPSGNKAQKLERKVKAYEQAQANLANKSYVVGLINNRTR